MASSLKDSLAFRGVRRVAKNSAQELRYRATPSTKQVIVILGCQRSGTTAMMHALDRSPWVRQFNEVTRHARRSDDGLSWSGGVPAMVGAFDRARSPLVVAKPLADSVGVAELLAARSNLDALWIYRSVDDVVRSNLRKFGIANGWRNLAPLLSGDEVDWRSRGASDHVIDTMHEAVRLGIGPEDAQALFWWSRNRIPFDQGVVGHERFWIIDYDQWVVEPYESLAALWAKVPLGVVDRDTFSGVARSPASGSEVALHPDVRALCDQLMADMQEASAGGNRGDESASAGGVGF